MRGPDTASTSMRRPLPGADSVRVDVLVPDRLRSPSGGNRYNGRIISELAARGVTVRRRAVPGSWPDPGPGDEAVLGEIIAAAPTPDTVLLVDGLIASAAPTALAAAATTGRRVYALVHLPLPLERGSAPLQSRTLAGRERTALRAAAGVITTSKWTSAYLRRAYGLTGITCAPPGTDPAAVATGSDPARFLMVAALTPRKNHALVLSALSVLQDRDWSAHFVGPDDDGGIHAANVRAAASSGFDDGRIVFTGALNGAALERQFLAADLLLLPSLAEPFGMVVTEALAHGTPAIVSAGTGALEALAGVPPPERPGPTLSGSERPAPGSLPGAAVDPADAVELGRLLREWLDEPGLRAQWSAAAHRRRSTLRPWAQTATDILRAFHD